MRRRMDPFTRVVAAAERQSEEGDFPSWLLADIRRIASDPETYAGKVALIELLIRQVDDFDSYAGAGCFDTSVSAGTIQATLREIMR